METNFPAARAAALGMIVVLIVACEPSPYPYKAHLLPGELPDGGYPITNNDRKLSAATAAYVPKEVEVLSDPAGARIEVNDEYVGDAPLDVKVPESGGNFTKLTVIRAIAVRGGDYVQTKIFLDGASVPSRILFDMDLGPATPAVDVNINPPQ